MVVKNLKEINNYIMKFKNLYKIINKKHKQSAGIAMYTKDGQVFLVKPYGFTKKRAWGFPKGKIDLYEDSLTAAKREFKEETGISIPNNKIIYIGLYTLYSKKHGNKDLQIYAVEGLGNEEFKGSNLIKKGKNAGKPEIEEGKYWYLDEAKKVIHSYQKPFIKKLKELIKES